MLLLVQHVSFVPAVDVDTTVMNIVLPRNWSDEDIIRMSSGSRTGSATRVEGSGADKESALGLLSTTTT